jgi:hypothetical protein
MIRRGGALRHFANVLRRPETLDDRGHLVGGDTTIAESIPVSVLPLSGREGELARQVIENAEFAVECRGPCVAAVSDVIVINGALRLAVGYVEDVDQNGLHYRLLCSREVRQ